MKYSQIILTKLTYKRPYVKINIGRFCYVGTRGDIFFFKKSMVNFIGSVSGYLSALKLIDITEMTGFGSVEYRWW